jgi:hypothetical protein
LPGVQLDKDDNVVFRGNANLQIWLTENHLYQVRSWNNILNQ